MRRSNLSAKKFVNMINFARQFWSNAANCSEIYAILENQKGEVLYYVYITKLFRTHKFFPGF